MTSQELENRLLDFAALTNAILDSLPETRKTDYFRDQIFRASSSTVLVYSEARSAESRKDFIHKSNIVLKELRECHAGLRLMARFISIPDIKEFYQVLKEADELISIFVKTVSTARKNLN